MTKAFDFIKYLFRNWEFWPTYFGLAVALFYGGLLYSMVVELHPGSLFIGFKVAAVSTGMIIIRGIVFMIIKPLTESYKKFNELRDEEHNKLLKSLSANYES